MRDWWLWKNEDKEKASLSIVQRPLLIDWLERSVAWVCCRFPSIPLPDTLYIDEDGERHTWRSYFADTQVLFHEYVCEPVRKFCGKRTKEVFFGIDYSKISEIEGMGE